MQRRIGNRAMKSQIHSVDYKNNSVDFVNHSVDYKINTVDLRFQRTVFNFSLHIQYVLKALSVYIEHSMLSSVLANSSL